MLAFFCLGARYRPWRYFAALHSRVFGDGAAPRRTRCSPQPRQHSVFRASEGAFSKSCRPWQDLHECVLGRLAVAIFSRGAFSGARRWQNAREMRFPSVRRWQDCALMRSWPDWQWQYSRAMRSRGSCRGKIPPRCVPGRQSGASFALHASRKRPRTGKSPVHGKIRAPCIRNERALARYARHVSEKPCKQPFGNTPREDLARKDPFSLHGPLESCIVRRSCHPASTKRPSARNPGAADQRQTSRAPATPAPPNSASRQS